MNGKDEELGCLWAIVDTIVEVASPEKVVLFGSRSKGTSRSSSDYDFLVITRDIENEREVSRRIYRTLLDRRVGAAVDLVVVDVDKLNRHSRNPFYVYGAALREGKVYYDQIPAHIRP